MSSKHRWMIGRVASFVLVAVAAGATACSTGGSERAAYVTPGLGAPIDTADRAALLAYAATLSFDTATTAGDEQPLPLWDSRGAPAGDVIVRVEPERGASSIARADLYQGRIIARYQAEAAYSPLGIPAGLSYVWIDSVGAPREFVIPANPAEPVRSVPTVFEPHDPTYYGAGPINAARWVVVRDTVRCQRPCSPWGCCRCTTYVRP